MRGANASASGSRKPSAGSRRSAARNAPSFAAVSASAGPSPSQPPPTILLGCRSFWRPRLESPGQLPTDRPLADRRVRSLGSSSSRSERPGDADDNRARRRNRLRRLGGRSRSRIRPRLDRFPLGRMREKAMRSRAKEPPNCSTTGRSGKFHALYKHNGEYRKIRPFGDLPIDLLGIGGLAVAVPSRFEKGEYAFI